MKIDSQVVATCIWDTFDVLVFEVILGLYIALVPKSPIPQKQLALEQNWLKLGLCDSSINGVTNLVAFNVMWRIIWYILSYITICLLTVRIQRRPRRFMYDILRCFMYYLQCSMYDCDALCMNQIAFFAE